LAISAEAEQKTFAEIMGPESPIDELELDRLLEAAKIEHHRKRSRPVIQRRPRHKG
jgi:hypothetical protein